MYIEPRDIGIRMLVFCLLWCGNLRSQPLSDRSAGPTYDVRSYGAIGDGKTLNTMAIQHAIDDCRKKGGGTIVISPGNFVVGTLRLYSNMTLYFDAGAVLTGSAEDLSYGRQKDFGFTGMGAGNKTGILVASNEENISLDGYGTISGNGTSFMQMDSLQFGKDFSSKYTRQGDDYMDPKYGREDGPVLWKGAYEERPGVMAIFSGCKNITISHIRFINAPNWTIAFLNSAEVKISGVSIENNLKIPNSDGIDLYDSKDILIEGCNIQAGDDAIAVVSSTHVIGTGCILRSRSCGIRVGYNVFNDHSSGNILFNNIHIVDCNRGIGIFQRQNGNMENMIFSNMVISTRLHSGEWWGHGEPIHISSVPGLGVSTSGKIRHIRFANIIATGESGIVLYAEDKSAIEDVSFEQISLTIKSGPLEQGYGGNFDLRPVNQLAWAIFKHDIPAIFARNTGDMSIHDLQVHWEKGLPVYFTNAVACENCDNLSIERLHEIFAAAPGNRSAEIRLDHCNEYRIAGISTTAKKRKLLDLRGTN